MRFFLAGGMIKRMTKWADVDLSIHYAHRNICDFPLMAC